MNNYSTFNLDIGMQLRHGRRWSVVQLDGNHMTREKSNFCFKEFCDRPHSGRPATTVNEDNVKQAVVFITADKKIAIVKLCENLHHSSACS